MNCNKYMNIYIFICCIVVYISTTCCDIVTEGDDKQEYKLGAPYYSLSLTNVDAYVMPLLEWGKDSLEPYIDKETIEAHFNGHHNTYRKKTNTALAAWREEFPDESLPKDSLLNILMNLDQVPEKYRTPIRNSAGGFANHNIYWACMSPNADATPRVPSGGLLSDIEKSFGSFDAFKEAFTKQATTLFGSGYMWLSRTSPENGGKLELSTSANQDSPLNEGNRPILTLDVWEHAYYLKHQFRRPGYIEDWWMLVDWTKVEKLDQFWRETLDGAVKDEL